MNWIMTLLRGLSLSFLMLIILTYKVSGQNQAVYSSSTSVTQNYLTKWSDVSGSPDRISNSLLYDSGLKIGLGTVNPTALLHAYSTGTGFQDMGKFESSVDPSEGATRVWISNPVSSLLLQSYGTVFHSSLSRSVCISAQSGTKFIISSGANIPIQMYTNNQYITPSLSLTTDGKVGINTNSPSQRLEIYHSDATGGINLNRASGTSSKSEIKFSKAGNELYAIGNDIDNNGNQTFFIWDHVNSIAPLLINQKGKVGIGGVVPPVSDSIYRLYVDGGICTRDVKVTAGTFPDYVFEENYSLLSIGDLEEYIRKNRHLPGLPSAAEITKNQGYELGRMQECLTRVVEEQTLYILDLQRQINVLTAEIQNLKNN